MVNRFTSVTNGSAIFCNSFMKFDDCRGFDSVVTVVGADLVVEVTVKDDVLVVSFFKTTKCILVSGPIE